MVTVDHILTNYVGVRKEYLRLEQETKNKLIAEFMEIAHLRHKEKPLDTDSIDLFLSDQSPENTDQIGREGVRDNDMRDLLGMCERFYMKVFHNIIGPEFILQESKFTKLADHHGYGLKYWYASSFELHKKERVHLVKFVFDRHTLTLQCTVYDQKDEEVHKLSALLTAMKEMILKENEQHRCYRMIFATGAYNVEVDLSNRIITSDELDTLA